MTTTRTLLVLLVAVVGVALASSYVSPDDHLDKTTGPRSKPEVVGTPRREKPRPLTPQQAAKQGEQGGPKKGGVGGARRARGADSGSSSGSFASSGAGSFSGAGGNQFAAYPFHNPAVPVGLMPPMDFGAFFQYIQGMQQAFQQNAMNQGLANSYGITTQEGDVGANQYSKVSSASYSGFGGGYGGGNGGYGGGNAGYGGSNGGYGGGFNNGNNIGGGGGGEGASAVASIGPQGGYGSANLTPDIGNRFGGGEGGEGGQSGQFPAPSGGNYGVFTSSSSGSSDVNGKRTNFQQATSGINDNGKITSFTVKNPQ